MLFKVYYLKKITFISNVNKLVTKWKQGSPEYVVTLELLIVMPSLVLEELIT